MVLSQARPHAAEHLLQCRVLLEACRISTDCWACRASILAGELKATDHKAGRRPRRSGSGRAAPGGGSSNSLPSGTARAPARRSRTSKEGFSPDAQAHLKEQEARRRAEELERAAQEAAAKTNKQRELADRRLERPDLLRIDRRSSRSSDPRSASTCSWTTSE